MLNAAVLLHSLGKVRDNMACISGVGQSCTECRMCRDRVSGKSNENAGNEMVCVQQSVQDEEWNGDIPGQISMDEYLQSLE